MPGGHLHRWWWVVGVSVFLVGCALWNKPLVEPRVTLVDLRVKSVTLFESAMEIDVRVQNPNEVAFETKGIDFDLKINDRRLATGLSNKVVTVPAFGTVTIPILVYSNVWDILKGVYGIQGEETLSYGVRGKIHLKTARGFPKTLPFHSQGLVNVKPGPEINEKNRMEKSP